MLVPIICLMIRVARCDFFRGRPRLASQLQNTLKKKKNALYSERAPESQSQLTNSAVVTKVCRRLSETVGSSLNPAVPVCQLSRLAAGVPGISRFFLSVRKTGSISGSLGRRWLQAQVSRVEAPWWGGVGMSAPQSLRGGGGVPQVSARPGMPGAGLAAPLGPRQRAPLSRAAHPTRGSSWRGSARASGCSQRLRSRSRGAGAEGADTPPPTASQPRPPRGWEAWRAHPGRAESLESPGAQERAGDTPAGRIVPGHREPRRASFSPRGPWTGRGPR